MQLGISSAEDGRFIQWGGVMEKTDKIKEVYVKGYYDKYGDIIIPLTEDGGHHRIVKSYQDYVETKEIEND